MCVSNFWSTSDFSWKRARLRTPAQPFTRCAACPREGSERPTQTEKNRRNRDTGKGLTMGTEHETAGCEAMITIFILSEGQPCTVTRN